MKTIPLFLCFVCISFVCLSQEQNPNKPFSAMFADSTHALSADTLIPIHTTQSLDIDSLLAIESALDTADTNHQVRLYVFGSVINDSILMSSGVFDTLTDGSVLWRMKIYCPGAYTVNIKFSDIHLPQGAYLFTYNSQLSGKDGPLVDSNKSSTDELVTFPISGDTLYVEYYQPAGVDTDGYFIISEIIFGFRKDIYEDIENSINKNESKKNASTLNSSCSAEGIACLENDYPQWCREIRSIIRILWNSTSFGTGCLIDNTSHDGIPYVLTAWHCLKAGGGMREINNWRFQFGYINYVCNSYTIGNRFKFNAVYEYSGASFVAGWQTTDFLLVKMNDKPDARDFYNGSGIYYAGWDKRSSAASKTLNLNNGGFGYMSYTIDNGPPELGGGVLISCRDLTRFGDNNHWMTTPDISRNFAGASGSPLFDWNSQRIIGQLNGGCLFPCEETVANTYGAFHVSWEGGGTPTTRLKDWLDPSNILGSATGIDGHWVGDVYMLGYELKGENQYSFGRKRAVHTTLIIGSSKVTGYPRPTIVTSSANFIMKAGKEIDIKPCTWVKRPNSGTEFRAYIEPPSCTEVFKWTYGFGGPDYIDEVVSNNSSYSYTTNCGSSWSVNGHEIEKKSTNDTPLFDELPNGTLAVVPNPTDGMVTIYYSVALAGTARVEIVNLYGQSISTIADGEQRQGNHTVNFNTQELPNGVYFVQFRSPIGVISKPIIVSH